ncbi:HRDC domain-containing protein [Paenibacillus sp. JSM ZJ436]|uniref:HRDC domain-containing protein n=1 Tax=Paenibacillus sp. JSM ZJ436 TaxID=3376190 RepID=UPI00378F5402
MDIVFMNQMSRPGSGGHETAQLWIGEEEGSWYLGWRGSEGEGEAGDEAWYEGGSWQELLCVYRHGLAQKLALGYRPVIAGVFHEPEESGSSNRHALRLQCYSERRGSEELYSELCAWRRRKAAAGRKAPYFIASNRVLRMISAFIPKTQEELLQLPGIGSTKAQEHGEDWLEMTSRVERAYGFPLNWVEAALEEDEFMSWLYTQKEQKYKLELEKYRTNRQLLEGIAGSLNMEALSEVTGMSRRAVIEAVEALEKAGYNTEPLISAELAVMPEEEQDHVWKALEELGDTFLKPILQRVYGEEEREGLSQEQLYERLRLIRIRYRRERESHGRRAV